MLPFYLDHDILLCKINSSNIQKTEFLLYSIDRSESSDFCIIKKSVNNYIFIKQILNWINLFKIISGNQPKANDKLRSIDSRKTAVISVSKSESAWLPRIGLCLLLISLPKSISATRASLVLLNRECTWSSAEDRILKFPWHYQWTRKLGYKWMDKTDSSERLRFWCQLRLAVDQPNI